MQIFIDSATQQIYQFNDDVVVAQEGGNYVFTTPYGAKYDVPDTLVPGELPAPLAPQPITRFSTLDYFSRFTDAEYGATRGGPMPIQRGLDMLIAAQYVDLADPRVEQYLDALVQAQIIDSARKAELLTPEAT